MRTKRDGTPKSRFFMALPVAVYRALKEAAEQNYCTMATYVIRALMAAFARDGIKCEQSTTSQEKD